MLSSVSGYERACTVLCDDKEIALSVSHMGAAHLCTLQVLMQLESGDFPLDCMLWVYAC